MQNELRMLAVLVATACCGCKSGEPARHPVLVRAAADLDCAEDELDQVPVDEGTVTVEGCGRRATYVKHCESRFNAAASAATSTPTSTRHCQWVAKSR